jgi:hypothetical protein
MGRRGWYRGEPDFPVAMECLRDSLEKGDPQPLGMEWLLEMTDRVNRAKPAVTEAEYEALADWYIRHEQMLYDMNIRYRICQVGARRFGATELVEKLRSLRAMHPELD